MKITRDQVVDLSQPLLRRQDRHLYDANPDPTSRLGPRDERFSLEQTEIDTTAWYIESIAQISGLAGTHVRLPFATEFHGTDAMRYPTERLVGECVVIDVRGKHPGQDIKLADVKKAEGRIHEDDIVFLMTGYDVYYRTGQLLWPPITTEALDWLLDQGIKVLGTDAVSFEFLGGQIMNGPRRKAQGEPALRRCLSRGVAVVESLTNLEAIADERATAFVLPVPMEDMPDSSVRVVALKA